MKKMKICTCNDCEIFETQRWVGNNLENTGNYRVRVPVSGDVIAFDLPGRGGKVTQLAAKKIHALWHSGKSAGEIQKETGYPISS